MFKWSGPFSFQPLAACHKSGLCYKIFWLYGIILAFGDMRSVCFVFHSAWIYFFFFFFFSLLCPMQESISQATAFLLCHPGFCPVWGHGSLLFDGGIPYPLCYVTTSGPGCGFHHFVLCSLSLLPSECSRLIIKEKISLNKLVALFFSYALVHQWGSSWGSFLYKLNNVIS